MSKRLLKRADDYSVDKAQAEKKLLMLELALVYQVCHLSTNPITWNKGDAILFEVR